MNYDRIQMLAQAFVSSFSTTITTLRRSAELGGQGFELTADVEDNYQSLKPYIAGTTNPQQIILELRRITETTLHFMSRVAPRQEW